MKEEIVGFFMGFLDASLNLIDTWLKVMTKPRLFFREMMGESGQGEGLVFVMVLATVEEGSRLIWIGSEYIIIILGITVFIATPILLHIVAAIQTILLRFVKKDRNGMSLTVKVICYSLSPCIFMGLTVPFLRVICAVYGWAILVIGIKEAHGVSMRNALLVTAIPSIIIFGYMLRGLLSIEALVPLFWKFG
jgi:hypothetical protein